METKIISSLKSIFFILLCIVFGFSSFAQEEYTVQNEELILYVEEQGELTLLSERTDKIYRLFLKKDDRIKELTQENYKITVTEFTSKIDLDIEKLEFKLRAISDIVYQHNNGGEETATNLSNINTRLGAWGGLSNFTSFVNPENKNIFFAGLEAEVYSETDYTRNSIIAQVRKSFPENEFDLDITELMIGYRFKVVDQDFIHFYLEAELVTFGRYQETYTSLNAENFAEEITQTNTALDAPLGLGAGLAVKLFKENYLTLGYSNLIKIGNSTRSDFPVDVRLGFKFRL